MQAALMRRSWMKMVLSAASTGMSFDSADKDVEADDILEEDTTKVEKEASM